MKIKRSKLAILALCSLAVALVALFCAPLAGATADETTDTGIVQELASSDALDFLYIDQAELYTGASQDIAVSLTDSYQDISAATLHLQRTDDGTELTSEATTIVDSALLFSLGSDVLDMGTYTVTALDVTTATGSYSISFDDCDNCSFDVVEGLALLSDGEEEGHESTTAYTFDDDGNLVEADSVADALADAQSEEEEGISLQSSSTSSKGIIVALNPGHGGNDSGAVGINGAKEADITWKIATYCKQELENTYGITVYMTRSQNENPSLQERATRAYNSGASVYISIHINSATGTAYGSEVWVPNNSSYNNETHAVGTQLGNQILAKLNKLGLYNRGVRTRDYPADGGSSAHYVDGSTADYYADVRNPRKLGMTGIIIEHAFIDNASDYYNYLSTDAQLKKLGVADAQGIAQDLSILGGVSEEAYAAVYDYDYYLAHNADVKAAYGTNNRTGVFQHFLSHGMAEGRVAIASFDVQSYYNANADLRAAYGFNLVKYYEHWMSHCNTEKNRTTTGASSITSWAVKQGGTDYSSVYNGSYYLNKYSDLKAVYSKTINGRLYVNDSGLLAHFVKSGMGEGRRACEGFDPVSYYNANKDLRLAFGTNIKSYYSHYMKSGIKEGRTTTGATGITSYVTKYDGTEYSPVYDGSYYRSTYADLEKAFTVKVGTNSLFNDVALIKHFVNSGMKEGRQANKTFDVVSYYNANQDLRKAFGTVFKSYYTHYLNYGVKEKRTCLGVDTINAYMTKYSSTDYKLVYDGAYYLNKYSDLKKTFTKKIYNREVFDDLALLLHFVNHGMKEGRQAKDTFNVQMYRSNYADLQKAFGSNLPKYYAHYMSNGYKEGRVANKYLNSNSSNATTNTSTKIMGTSLTTVNQMVSYYSKVKGASKYPASTYKSKGAATLKDFCQIVYEEAKAEGVRAEVVFCQAMHETGWLQFGGDVKASQCNFAGIGATGGGVGGATFSSVRQGIRAQVQHLKAYASTAALNNACVDPRFNLVTRGCAPTLQDLGGKWATDKSYGNSIYALVTALLAC